MVDPTIARQDQFISKKITLTVSAALLKQVNVLAKRDYTTRSGIIRLALLEYIRKPANSIKLKPVNKDDYADILAENPYLEVGEGEELDIELLEILKLQKNQSGQQN